ncbi:MAG: ParA family protein [Bryobacteraceae bacterium]
MIKITVSNQRGGVGKTITAMTLARCFADRGKRVLLVDTDSQGSIWMALQIEPEFFLHHLVNDGMALSKVAVKVHERVDVVCSDRRTMRVEGTLNAAVAKEMTFYGVFQTAETDYDAVLIDVAPSISNLQTCAMAYTKDILIPVSMDSLAVEGALASLTSLELLNRYLKLGCRCLGFLPTQVDQRTSATEVVLRSLGEHSKESGIPIIRPIRTDQAVNKALRNHKFLQDWDPRSKALEDYDAACDELLKALAIENVEAYQQTR